MKKISETIVFFGSGSVAARSLELLARDFHIEAVITKQQPLHHKQPFPVLEVTKRLQLKTLTPGNKAQLSQLFAAKPVSSRIGVVIDYGFIINQDVIDYFPLGIVNSHFSLLPEWRGADPITFSILSGQKQTGISLMLITAGLDEGPLLAQTPFDLPEGITNPELTNELIEISHNALVQVLPLYYKGEAMAAPQEEVTMASSKIPTYSRKLIKHDGIIDWNKPAIQLEREVRAFIEWPKSRTVLAGYDVIITASSVVDKKGPPGTILSENKELIVFCGSQALRIERLKPAGKNDMKSEDFLRGYRLQSS